MKSVLQGSAKSSFPAEDHLLRVQPLLESVLKGMAVNPGTFAASGIPEGSTAELVVHVFRFWCSIAGDIKRATDYLGSATEYLKRLADHFTPTDQEKVGSPYVARALHVTTTWVGEMARKGTIPKSCVVDGTGDGKPWKFHRARIDDWIRTR